MKFIILFILFPVALFAQPSSKDISRWQTEAQKVTIIRDNWGIPHIYGKSDADAVFGLLYAQCEDDFKRVEMNYIEKLGRLSEVKGISSLYDDLLMRMVIDSADAMADYKKAPVWLKKLMDAFADGINYYLYKHPDTKPALLRHFEPWYPLLWTDGSIGAINTADLDAKDVKELYSIDNKQWAIGNEQRAIGNRQLAIGNRQWAIDNKQGKKLTNIRSALPIADCLLPIEKGSNGLALSYKITASGNCILYINPHVTFYFRPEVHMVSEEGLNVYGAVTWGQFFVYQGFNEHCGWMHTSSDVDAADSYIEKMSKTGNKWMYEYDGKKKPVIERKILLKYKNGNAITTKTFTALFTHHGPVMAKTQGQYLSVRADNRLMNGLIQCWQRDKAQSFTDFKKTLDLLGNISNNTVYADAEGNIAYWHGNRIPIRDTSYDWSKPVDGSIKATEWKGYHTVDQTVHIINPKNGWLQNCNSTPFSAAGKNSPSKKDYPAYMAPDEENFRGINAVRILESGSSYTMSKLIASGYDNRLAAFEVLVPALLKAFDAYAQTDAYGQLAEPMKVLRKWNFRTYDSSVATTLAITWGERIYSAIMKTRVDAGDSGFVEKTKAFAATATPDQLLQPFATIISLLQQRNGKWEVPWGDINRYQRISSDIDQQYKDDQPSIPVGFASSRWGMLPSYTSKYFPGTTKRYGVDGNSFICAVEFGKKVKARSLLAGGESGDPSSKHFNDQMEMYAKGKFKDVLFYKEDVLAHVERSYHPGE
jgi:acyl-homoserine-lactone acylase